MKTKHLIACLAAGLLALLWAGSAFAAAQTGDIRGLVVGPEGDPVEDARVVIASPSLLGTRATETAGDGSFRFISLPPGVYEIQVQKEGLKAEIRRGVRVSLDRTTTTRIGLQLATGEETVEVVAEQPVIDTTSAAISETVGAEYLDNLPVGRSYQDVIRTLPGVSGRIDYEQGGPSGGNPSVRGEGQYGNNFLLDGFSTRDPATHTFGTNVHFDAIEQITVFTDGAPAEYGEATGMIANVVTKSGTDEFHGSVGVILESSFSNPAYDWGGKDSLSAVATEAQRLKDEQAALPEEERNYDCDQDGYDFTAGSTYMILDTGLAQEVCTPKRRFFDWSLNGTLGGPLVKEKLHFFTAFEYGQGWYEPEGAPFIDLDDDGAFGAGEEFLRQTSKSHLFLGKVTWSPVSQARLSYSYLNNAQRRHNYLTSTLVQPEAQADYSSTDSVHNLNGTFYLSDSLVLEAKGMLSRGRVDVVPASGNTVDASYYDIGTGEYYGNHDSADYNRRNREGVAFSLTKYLTRALGEHQIKVGVEYHHTFESRELVYSGGYQYVTDLGYGPDEIPGTDDDMDPIAYTEYTDVGELGHHGYSPVIYGQDSWNPWPWLTVNYGLRVEQVRLTQNDGSDAVNQWMTAPRLGISWDVTRDGKTQVAFSAGRYFDPNSNDFAGWADSRSAFVFKEYTYDRATGGYELTYEQDPAGNPAHFDPELSPYHADRLILSFKRELLRDFAAGVRGIYSKTSNIPEDVIQNLDFEYLITNPEVKQRTYWGVELTAEKRMSDGLQILASYTYSQAKGTTPGNFELPSGGNIGSAGNEVGVFLDTPGGADRWDFLQSPDLAWLVDGLDGMGYASTDPETGEVTYNAQGYDGYLPYHSFHNIKVNASYTMPWKTTVGLVFELDSGHAWQKRGLVWLYGDYYSFPEGRGSRFMPPVAYFDLHLGQLIPLGKTEVEVSLDIFNLFGMSAPISYYENDNDNFGLTLYRQAPRSLKFETHFRF